MQKDYKGLIWTNHALKRMRERGIKQGDAWATWKNPDRSKYAETRGAWIYYRTFGSDRIEVVAKKNEKGEWIIISVWSREAGIKPKRSRRKDRKRKGFSLAAFFKRLLQE